MVLKSTRPFADADLPVPGVQSWEDAVVQLSLDPNSLYDQISSKTVDHATLQHYLSVISSA
jgi:hypothetical protein